MRKRALFDETDPESRPVRHALFAVIRRVAILRGRRRGLRDEQPDTFATMSDEDAMWAGITLVWDATSIYDGKVVLDAALAMATRPQQALYAIWWTISEVRNGGFSQYFNNATGIVAPYARDGLTFLGMGPAAALIARAMTPFADIDISDRRARHKILDDLDFAFFDPINVSFYELVPEMFRVAAAHVREHPGEFFEL